MSTEPVNDPATRAAVEAAFDAYERALTTNDIPVLDTLFWNSPHTLRYGATENLQGYEAIRAFRAQRPGKGLTRTIIDRSVTTFGTQFAVANITFARAGESRIGRQSQTWACIDGQWRVVAAHVSWMDPS
ncbi:oxalurate catabolism protein HpxZ [Paraburkholderia heleia]|uniref:oxalurate catabolism protein HpxZ n=1 Tax=Paraburkholderia heleia TaxID=634127 RepID=UPI0005A76D9F|nr:oxalurate catabolism protein HpxZ [Paraburkholderia heleia]